MKLKCDCGNTDPTQFSVVEQRTIWLNVEHKDGVFLQPGGNVIEEMTDSTRLWCDSCATEQEII